jgi:hypothetical protein
MSGLLYYSNYCENCKKLLTILAKTANSKDLHFICIDERVRAPNGGFYIMLPNGGKLDLPATITRVPALMLPNHGFQVLFGEQIYQHLQPKEEAMMMKATGNQGEPECFALSSGNHFGISSDHYSFLDMSADDMLAKGGGGTRQMHNYVSYDGNAPMIETPPDDYVPDKVQQDEYDRKKSERNF